MPVSDLDCVFFVQKPPVVSFEDGMFKLCFEVGRRATFEIVMSPSTFLKMRRNGGRAADRFHSGKRNIIGFTDPSKADSGQH